MKKLSYLLILGGIVVFCYPIYNYYSSVTAEKALLETWNELDEETIAEEEMKESFNALDEIFLSTEDVENELEVEVEEEIETEIQEEPQPVTQPIKTNKDLLGLIEIDKIEVKLPILAGASDANLKKGAGHLNGTSRFGEIGNSAVAAHRSRTYGRQFNRLDELKVGDEIKVITEEETYTYIVFEKKIVNPTDVYVLNKMGDKRIITLITCDPIVGATHRLIVHGELQK